MLYLIVPLLIRDAVSQAVAKNNLKHPPYPPRRDGGRGWFVVEEHDGTEHDGTPPFSSGCNNYPLDRDYNEYISWFWIGKYFSRELNLFLHYLRNNKLRIKTNSEGFITADMDEEIMAKLLKFNLIEKCKDSYKPVFAYFKGDELCRFEKLFESQRQEISLIVEKLVIAVYEGYRQSVPKRLLSQITGIFEGYLNTLVGLTVNELENRGILARVPQDSTLTANIMYVSKNA